jgi:RNA polymerase sigma factor (sigma-70 family)
VCGDIGRSEDLAQEVFIAAWRQLAELREPGKLRAWLAGITRNLAQNAIRCQHRVPTVRAEEMSQETPSDGESPRDQAIRKDEAALMWSALKGIPENYREPMVLFYREQRSVEAVAETLEISEENVRQRLVRGRAMLTERMAKIVQETLERSAPTPAFAGAVLLAVPIGVMPVAVVAEVGLAGTKAATGGLVSKTVTAAGIAGAAAAKSGLVVKALAVVGFIPAIFNGALEFLRFRTNFEATASLAKRRQIAVAHLAPKLIWALLVLSILCLRVFSRAFGASPVAVDVELVVPLILVLCALVWLRRWRKRMDAAEALPEYIVGNSKAGPGEKAFEYRSPRTFFGMPLLHIYVGGPLPAMQRTARGLFAVSDGIAVGGIFAAGGQLAAAPISLGPVAVGLLSFGVPCAEVNVVTSQTSLSLCTTDKVP